jgi:hypothetical protein
MGEIADDCYDRAENELADMSPWEREQFEDRMAANRQINERRAQWRRNNQRSSVTSVRNAEPPF